MPALEPRRIRAWPLFGALASVLIGCAHTEEGGCGEGVFYGDLVSVYSEVPGVPVGAFTLFVGPTRQAAAVVATDVGVLPGPTRLEMAVLDCAIPDLGAWDVKTPACESFAYAAYRADLHAWEGELRGECDPVPEEGPKPVYDPPSTPFRFEFTAHRVGPSLTAAER